jgi:peptide/nickel transport system substrate-binding protein
VTIRAWDPPHFDPYLTVAYKTIVPTSFTHSRLLRHKAGPDVPPGAFMIEGDLAESWSQPNDTTYAFKLRRGVRWHAKPPVNGRELTSEDVRYSIERFLTVKGNANAYMLRAIDRVETPDPHTVKITLKEPFAWFLDMLAYPVAMVIVARECVEKFGDLRKPEAVVGTGPWMLDGYRPNIGLTLVRHPQYFRAGLPYIDRVELVVDEDNASRMSAFSQESTTSGGRRRAPSIAPTGCRSATPSSSAGRPSRPPSSRAASWSTSRCGRTSRPSTTCVCGRRWRSRSTARASSTRRWRASGC